MDDVHAKYSRNIIIDRITTVIRGIHIRIGCILSPFTFNILFIKVADTEFRQQSCYFIEPSFVANWVDKADLELLSLISLLTYKI